MKLADAVKGKVNTLSLSLRVLFLFWLQVLNHNVLFGNKMKMYKYSKCSTVYFYEKGTDLLKPKSNRLKIRNLLFHTQRKSTKNSLVIFTKLCYEHLAGEKIEM